MPSFCYLATHKDATKITDKNVKQILALCKEGEYVNDE